MINKFAKKLVMKESKENSMASPTPVLVHLSTYPLKLAQKSEAKKQKQADSASSNVAVTR